MPVNIFGRDPNQVPLNSHLGNLAYQNSDGTVLKNVSVQSGIMSGTHLGIGSLSNLTVTQNVSIANTLGIGSFITITPYNTLNSGTLSFEGSAGQLFSITNNLTSGSIFSVNDISGIPSIDVDANGTIQLAAYGGNVGIGTRIPESKLDICGGNVTLGDNSATGVSISRKNTNSFLSLVGGIATTGSKTSGGANIELYGISTGLEGRAYYDALSHQFRDINEPPNLYVSISTSFSYFSNTILIGSASPTGTSDQKLQVTGGAYVSGNLGVGNTNPFSGNGTNIHVLSSGTSRLWLESSTAATGRQFYIESLSTGALTFVDGTAGSERARFDTIGRLLVGVTTSTSQSGVRGLIQVEALSANEAAIKVKNNSNNTAPPYVAFTKSRGTTVGSSTTVQNGDSIGSLIWFAADGTDTESYCAEIYAQMDGAVGVNSVPGRLLFLTAASGQATTTERMRIDSSGRVGFDYPNLVGIISDFAYGGYKNITAGINTTTFSSQRATWFLRGSLQNTNTEGANCILLLQDTGGAAVQPGDLIKGYTSTTLNFRVANNGAVQNTPNSYGAISDQRLKQDIVDAGSQWQDIKNIRVRKFKFKDEIEVNSREYIGVIAQEIEQVSPGLIDQFKTEDGEPDPSAFKSVKYSVLYMKAIKALQEAMDRIEILEQRLNDAGIS